MVTSEKICIHVTQLISVLQATDYAEPTSNGQTLGAYPTGHLKGKCPEIRFDSDQDSLGSDAVQCCGRIPTFHLHF
jgi:hypothetical protein